MPVSELMEFINYMETQLTDYERELAKRIFVELKNRVGYLIDVGLGYLTLSRMSNTLSGGESQRINLATSLGSSLVGSMYILDEPTTGLHFADVAKLIEILQRLTDGGNTVVVIEHNLDIIKSADYIIDLGPESGDRGGEIVATGTPKEIARVKNSYTGQYLKKILND